MTLKAPLCKNFPSCLADGREGKIEIGNRFIKPIVLRQVHEMSCAKCMNFLRYDVINRHNRVIITSVGLLVKKESHNEKSDDSFPFALFGGVCRVGRDMDDLSDRSGGPDAVPATHQRGSAHEYTAAYLDYAGNLRLREGRLDPGCFECWLNTIGTRVIFR